MDRTFQRFGGELIQPIASLRNRFFIRAIRVIRGFLFGIRVYQTIPSVGITTS
jgi:hypothetical protein